MRGEYIRFCLSSIEDEDPESPGVKALMASILEFSESIGLSDDKSDKLFQTVEGRARLLYESLKTTTPGIAHHKCVDFFYVMDGDERKLDHKLMAEFFNKFALINDLDGPSEGEKKKT